jgi:hypothetical protein
VLVKWSRQSFQNPLNRSGDSARPPRLRGNNGPFSINRPSLLSSGGHPNWRPPSLLSGQQKIGAGPHSPGLFLSNAAGPIYLLLSAPRNKQGSLSRWPKFGGVAASQQSRFCQTSKKQLACLFGDCGLARWW